MGTTTRQAPGAVPLKCHSCSRPLESPLFCQTCGQQRPDDGLSHFELLGLPVGYEIDAVEMRRRFLRLSRSIHPDLAGGEGAMHAAAQQNSARLNAAYETLSDPVRRAEYLLEISGGPSATVDKRVPQAVLALALNAREEIEEARATGDTAALEGLRRNVESQRAVRLARIAELARQLPGDAALWSALREELNTMRYFARIIEQLDA